MSFGFPIRAVRKKITLRQRSVEHVGSDWFHLIRTGRRADIAIGGNGLIAAGGKQVWVPSAMAWIRHTEILE
jgi:hypothetical protein